MDNSLGLDTKGETIEPVPGPIGNDWGNNLSADQTWGGETDWGASEAAQPSQPAQAQWGGETDWGAGEAAQDQAQDQWGGNTDWGVADTVKDPDQPPPESRTPSKQDGRNKDKGKPYIPAAPAPREKMSPDELAERMKKIRLQNEKIKERREHVKADEEAFRTSLAADRAKQVANRKVQAQINFTRDQNAKRKLEKMSVREWDSGKQGGKWKQGKNIVEQKEKSSSPQPPKQTQDDEKHPD